MFSHSLENTNESGSSRNGKKQEEKLIYNTEPETGIQNANFNLFIDEKTIRMMQKMGYKSGSGLGKNEQGITKVIEVSCQLGRKGLGSHIETAHTMLETWDFTKEDIKVKENIVWLENEKPTIFSLNNMNNWIKEGLPNHDIEHELNFCDKEILQAVIQAKDIFDKLDLSELWHARARANPFETIRSVFFMNRAALKMANIDAATEFMFSNIDKNAYHGNLPGPFYFADVCAGPGGFTEYMLWRKHWFFKGFGLTLKDQNDFKITDSVCASPVPFQALYGKQEDGNVCCPENIMDFKETVLHETDGIGVHFMMSDGGFSVEGNENIQEILSKNIYICQCLVALEIVRTHGHFVTKLFDTFTPFSVGLLYLMYNCFEKVSIFKPNSSRPANSERYLICYNLQDKCFIESIKKYLWTIVKRLWEIKHNSKTDILEIVPLEILKQDKNFYFYVIDSNNKLAKRQTQGLQKLEAFCINPNLVETRQEELRKKCLEFWQIPDKPKSPLPQLTVDDLLNLVLDKPEILLVQPREIDNINNFKSTITEVEDWHYCGMHSSQNSNNCNFYAGVGCSKVYRLQRNKWIKVKNMQLCRGTLLYGEFVKEKITKIHAETDSYKYSLHVIDALQLGEKSLADLRFNERINLIQIYCKSVNKECQPSFIRIRPKIISKLSDIALTPLLRENQQTGNYVMTLPTIGYNSHSEELDVNSLMFLKTNNSQSFHSTYVLRVHIFLRHREDENEEKKSLILDDITTTIKQKL